ncbi:MAG: terminase family protein [Sphingomonadales bacterium]|nr:terminase family protein [Sphingomonadales bacterium]
MWARASQLPPEGDWRVWLIMAGRGFGKTRAGAEWVRMVAESNHEARIALVASSLHEARSVMVEGESGLMAISSPYMRPRYEPSLRRIVWPTGAQALLYSAADAEALRGPQHSHARRAEPEGIDRKRGHGRAGRPAPPGDRSSGYQPANGTSEWTVLAGRDRRDRRVRWADRPHRSVERRRLALPCPARGNARL